MATFLQRLLELRGEASDAEFARRCGIKYTTMKNYLAGRSLPPLDVAAQIADMHGRSLDWLFGRDKTPPAKAMVLPAGLTVEVHAEAISVIGHLVAKLHKDAGIRLPGDTIVDETARHFQAVMKKMDDPSDINEFRSLILWVEDRISKELRAAAEAPGTGKRSA